MSVVVAVDGGGSKTDVVVAGTDGAERARRQGPGCSQHLLGTVAAAQVVDATVRDALAAAGVDHRDVVHAGCYLTAIDLDDEQDAMHAALRRFPWAAQSLVVDNDVLALLRAGTDEPDAAVVVCGTGINGAAVRADGRTARILSLGPVSGDWGGATGLADAMLWHAARAEDGRGPDTALRRALPSWVGRPDVRSVVIDLHTGRLDRSALWPRMPELFALAHAGDDVARALVERQGREIALLAVSLLGRVDLLGATVPVVLGGGIGASGDPILRTALGAELWEQAPHARVQVAARPPVDGARDLALAAVTVSAG